MLESRVFVSIAADRLDSPIRELSSAVRSHAPSARGVMRRIAGWAFAGLSTIVIIVAIAAIVVPRLIGAVPLVVLTGSMVPVFAPGDLIVSQPVDVGSIVVGDVITFQPKSDDPALITHRVAALAYGQSGLASFITRGDANGADDQPVLIDQVMGKYLYHIPVIGYLTVAIPVEHKPLIMNSIGIIFIIVSLFNVVQITRTRAKNARKKIGRSRHAAHK